MGRAGEQHLFFGLDIVLDIELVLGLFQKRVPVVGRRQPVSDTLLFYHLQIVQSRQHPRQESCDTDMIYMCKDAYVHHACAYVHHACMYVRTHVCMYACNAYHTTKILVCR